MSLCDKCMHKSVCCGEGYGDEALTYCIDFLDEKPYGEWIPCSERLPEQSGDYLVLLDYEFSTSITVSYFYGKDTGDWHHGDWVSAWMPLPTKPYEKEGEKK